MNDATEPHPEGEAATLCHDVTCVFIECSRDRLGDGVMRADVNAQALNQFAAVFARRLAHLIGGRYVAKRDARAARDAAVWRAFTGRNHGDVMREFSISRRLLYSILARKRRAP